MRAGLLTRTLHHVHRVVGSALALLLAVWFASGAVMAFARYPALTEPERLSLAPALPREGAIVLPAVLRDHLARGGLSEGRTVRLSVLEQRPTWTFVNGQGARVALRADRDEAVAPLDVPRARMEIARRLGSTVTEIERVTEPDQWTVGFATAETLPFFRMRADGGEGREVYLSAATGELLQESTRIERALSWLGAIPHWIYPTLLRRQRALWRDVVLVLAGAGLLVSLSGSLIGLHVLSVTVRRGRAPRDRALHWHQRLGLGFGLFASTWLFSGALSLSPFHWTGAAGPTPREQQALYARSVPGEKSVQEALRACQREISVRELTLTALAGRVYAVCADDAADTRLIDLSDPSRAPSERVSPQRFDALARDLSATGWTLETAYDDYHYPTHALPQAALPYVRMALGDADESVLYLDPARARLLMRHTRLTRLERWLYNGLHSLDLPALYAHRTLWRTLIVAAMAIGFALSTLGLAMASRRAVRARRGSARRARVSGSSSVRPGS